MQLLEETEGWTSGVKEKKKGKEDTFSFREVTRLPMRSAHHVRMSGMCIGYDVLITPTLVLFL